MMTRRQALKTTVVSTLACTSIPTLTAVAAQSATPAASGPFKLPPLPYPADALEPHIDAQTMEIHHGKHHAAYVNNANKALADFPDLASKAPRELLTSLNSLPEKIRTTIRNNAGGHYNHSLFWQMMKKNGGQPAAELNKAIEAAFGNMAGFKEKFTDASLKVFGSGWAWLVKGPDGKLAIESSPNQDSPIMTDPAKVILLGLDVWEHAYYLKFQNRRADYINAWFNVVNWDFVSERFARR